MASIGKLISAIAAAEGLDEGAVKLIARYAREAGYISQGSFGPGAARMTARDAANLLIAVNASNKAKDAPTVVPIYRELVPVDELEPITSDQGLNDRLADLDREDPLSVLKLPVAFGHALEILLLGFTPEGNGRTKLAGYASDTFEVSFHHPKPRATILIGDYSDPEHQHAEYFTTYGVSELEAGEPEPGQDKRDVTTITWRTLQAVGRVLAT